MSLIEPVHFLSDGLTLEGELAVPTAATACAVIAHPHPQHGGNMRSIVPGALFGALPDHNVACLRFNFRGIGESQGSFGGGVGERHDLQAAIATMHEISEGLPLLVAGWSFGADTALCVNDDVISGWFLVAPPLRDSHYPNMVVSQDHRPKHFSIPQNDQFRPPREVVEMTEGWVNTHIEVVGGADHFLVGRTDVVVSQAVMFLGQIIGET